MIIMNEHDKREGDGSKVSERNHSERKLWVIFGFLCVIVLVLGALLVVVLMQRGSSDGGEKDTYTIDNSKEDDEIDEASDEGEVEEDYYDKLRKVSVQEYIAEMDKKIESATSNEEKRDLYIEKAVNLQYFDFDRSEMLEMALKDLHTAEELSPNMKTAFWLYYYEDQTENIEAAKEYLQKAKERGYDETKGEG